MTSAVNPLFAAYAAISAAIPCFVNASYVAFSALEKLNVVYIVCSAAVVSLVALANFSCASAKSFAICSAFLLEVGRAFSAAFTASCASFYLVSASVTFLASF